MEPPVASSEPVQAAVAEPIEDSPVSREIAALVSPAVGERVAQSFGALAEAVDAGPRRSFDEIAEDMLRPMLQEWLDDNLPTLVERLVREEIERVARGPRR
jgi:cell pole-organizing protein PopZ